MDRVVEELEAGRPRTVPDFRPGPSFHRNCVEAGAMGWKSGHCSRMAAVALSNT